MKCACISASCICTVMTLALNREAVYDRLMDFKTGFSITDAGGCFRYVVGLLTLPLTLMTIMCLSPMWVMLLFPGALSAAESTTSKFEQAVSFNHTVLTKTAFVGFLWMLLASSLVAPNLTPFEFGLFAKKLLEQLSHGDEASQVLACAKVGLMCAAVMSIGVLIAGAHKLGVEQAKWNDADRRSVHSCSAELLECARLADNCRSFLERYHIVDERFSRQIGGREDSSDDPILEVVLRKIIDKVYGDAGRATRITDPEHLNYNPWEEFLRFSSKPGRVVRYMSPSALEADIDILLSRVPDTNLWVEIPEKRLLLHLRAIRQRLESIKSRTRQIFVLREDVATCVAHDPDEWPYMLLALQDEESVPIHEGTSVGSGSFLKIAFEGALDNDSSDRITKELMGIMRGD